MKRLALPVVLTLLLGLLTPPARAAGKVTLASLLRQMTDLSLLAEYPDPPYVTKQFSSYDRASEAPGNDAWFANYDRGFMLYDGTVMGRTPYWKGDPKQKKPADGQFEAGTRVGIAPAPAHKPVGAYVWAYATAPDGRAIDGKIPQGYVEKSAIMMDPQGHVLADMDGPGCVVRLWSADPDEAGKVRIYLDGAMEPMIEAPLRELLGGKWKTQIGGKEVTPFPDPIACERSRGWNLYFPIAYQKHCKITVEKSDIYYHVDYRTYPKGTEVETFDFGKLVKDSQIVEAVRKDLAGAPGQAPRYDPDTLVLTPNLRTEGDELPPPELPSGLNLEKKYAVQMTPTSASFTGAGSVQVLYVRVGNARDLTSALRSLVLVGTFDGAAKPQVWCPLGDFFGTVPAASAYRTLPFQARRAGKTADFLASWVMPFEKSAKFSIHNYGKDYISGAVRPGIDAEKVARNAGGEPYVGFRIGFAPYKWTDRSMHFHARWRTATMNTRPFRDWIYCDLMGKGVFVGDLLTVFNPSPAWWGEGDEKIYVDGEKFPSWFGTGSEDYYAYAWGDPTPYQHAYHNQTRCDGPGSRGWTSVNRFQILDAVPFEKSFRFDMEVWHWTPNIDMTYAATSYWYARPGATDDFKEVDAKVLQKLPQLPPPYRIAGALEGEKLKVLGKSGDFEVGPQDMGPFADGKWSGDSHLWVRPPRKGEWVDLELPVAADGKFHVIAYLTKARDYGVVQFSLDGKPLGKPIDCWNSPAVVATGPIDLGEVELTKGPHTLRALVVGTNEKSNGLRYMWGLDCIVLKPG
jgi:hypothetical protein